MNANTIFSKTSKGQEEIDSRAHGLSMQHRRVLILVNGSNDVTALTRLSLCENVPDIIQTLVTDGFIQGDGDGDDDTIPQATEAGSGESAAKPPEEVDEALVGVADFMRNTLLTFANRVRVADLVKQIDSSESLDALSDLIKPWYMAISETPGGMYQADDLRDEVKQMIARES